MAITKAKIEAGVWRSWGEYWRSKPAERNIDTRGFAPEDALQVAPFTAAVLVLAKTVAASEWLVERMTSGGEWERITKGLPAWLDPAKRPNRWQSVQDFRKAISLNLTIYGNSLVVASEKTWDGRWPNRMIAYPWWNAEVELDGARMTMEDRRSDLANAPPGYGSIPINLSYVLGGRGGYMPLTAFETDGDVVHIRYATIHDVVFGHSPLSWAAPAVRTAVAADAFSELGFLYGMMGPGLMTHKGKPGEGLIKSMRTYMREVMRNPANRHSPLLVSGEWDYIRTQASAAEMEMLEQRKLAWSVAAAVFGVPRALLGDPDAGLSGTGVRHLQRYFAVFHAHEHLISIAQTLSEALPRGWRIRIVPSHLLDLEPAEQSRVFDRLIRAGVMAPSEARAELGLPPIDGLDDRWDDIVGGGGDGGDSDSGKEDGTEDEKVTGMDE